MSLPARSATAATGGSDRPKISRAITTSCGSKVQMQSVSGCECPKPDPPGAQAHGRTQFAGACNVRESQHTQVIAPLVHDKEAAAPGRRQAARPVGIVTERLLAVNRGLARQQRLDHVGMRCGRRRNDNPVDRRQIVEAGHHLRARLLGQTGIVSFGDHTDGHTERQQIARDEPAPPAATDKTDFHGVKTLLRQVPG